MERRLTVARLLITVPAAFLVIGPPLADLNDSHVLNSLWSGHARLHTVWLIATNALISLVALGVLWRPLLGSLRTSILLAGSLVGVVLSGFFVAAATQSFYGGSLTDPNGVAITVGPFDANLAVFSLHLCLLLAAFALARRPS